MESYVVAVLVVIPVFFFVNVAYIWSLWHQWCRDFSGARVKRSHKACASNSGRPKVKGCLVSGAASSEVALSHKACASNSDHPMRKKCPVSAAMSREDPSPQKELQYPTLVTSESLRKDRAEAWKRNVKARRTLGRSGSNTRLSEEHSEQLSMDHIYVGFWDFLWIYYFVAPNAVILFCWGIGKLLVRQLLNRYGWSVQKPCTNPRRVVGQLLLESMEVINFAGKEQTETGVVGFWHWEDFPYLEKDGSFGVGKLKVKVNLETKAMISAMLDESELAANEAIILIWFHTIFAGHVKLHAMANWAVNDLLDGFSRQNSIITVMYNYFGRSTFPRLVKSWQHYGFVQHNLRNITKVIDHGVNQGIAFHGKLRDLQQHSVLVDFVVKVRNSFLNKFQEYQSEFRGIDGEAMFVGTVLHSLDHSLMEMNLPEPLWLDVGNPKFGAMAEIGRFVRVGFTPDLPGIMFHKGFKNAPHPFHQAVYRHAARINKELADKMDTCIVK